MESNIRWANGFFDKFEYELIINGYSKKAIAKAVLDDSFEFEPFAIDQVVKTIRLLDKEPQQAVIDRYLLNKTDDQICKERLCSRSTFYRILRKATSQLRARFGSIEHTGLKEFEKAVSEVAV